MVNDVRVATLKQGNIFGETSIVTVKKADATVKVVSDSALILVLRHGDIVNRLSPAAWQKLEELTSQRAMENVSYTFLASIPIFSDASNEFLEALAHSLKFVSFPEGTTVLTVGESDNKGMFYISQGEAGVYDSKGLVRTLGPQDYVGENMLLAGPGARRLATLRSKTHLEAYQLTKADFLQLGTKFPHDFDQMKKIAKERSQEILPHKTSVRLH